MNFDTPLFQLRIRSGWEAADLGLLIWRSRPVALCVFFMIPLFAVTGILIPIAMIAPLPPVLIEDAPLSIMVLHIWLKPLYNRWVLHVCSTIFFNNSVRFRDLFRGIAGTTVRGLVGDLLWRRFSPLRGVMMPLRILEKTSRTQYAARKTALSGGGIHFGVLLTVFCVAAGIVLTVGAFLFAYSMDQILGQEFKDLNNGAIALLLFCFAFFNFVLIETLYVCMSFSVYINSRVITEGWDLQYAFKQLAARTHNSNDIHHTTLPQK
ncbi:MAG: hypothetical protein LBD22_02300 [Spirochaetaceae bacterium]|jgi:hypothetical protein|nr:hypothetical protein [Spirochaetaceae bacterium]